MNLITDATNTFRMLMSTMFTQKNVTKNNLGFLIGLTASAGIIMYGILNIFMPGILAVLIIFGATGYFGYRTLTLNEELPESDRKIMHRTSTY